MHTDRPSHTPQVERMQACVTLNYGVVIKNGKLVTRRESAMTLMLICSNWTVFLSRPTHSSGNAAHFLPVNVTHGGSLGYVRPQFLHSLPSSKSGNEYPIFHHNRIKYHQFACVHQFQTVPHSTFDLTMIVIQFPATLPHGGHYCYLLT